MYIAELKGKLSSKVERSEDILTSNVFSFFKYSNRTIFLKELLYEIGLNISDEELMLAQFLFWPRYDDNTEPDLVIIAGNYYILIEAKYFSGFGEETDNKKSQLSREIEGGILESKILEKHFILVAITADYSFKSKKFDEIKMFQNIKFKWINWQLVAHILVNYLESHDERDPWYLISSDLYDLLEKKNLRAFASFNSIKCNYVEPISDRVFLKSETTKYRGKFIGFRKALENEKVVNFYNKKIFFSKNYFIGLLEKYCYNYDKIFFKGGKNNGS